MGLGACYAQPDTDTAYGRRSVVWYLPSVDTTQIVPHTMCVVLTDGRYLPSTGYGMRLKPWYAKPGSDEAYGQGHYMVYGGQRVHEANRVAAQKPYSHRLGWSKGAY
eukprot:787420-Rhodomonas_salina.2